MNSTTNPRIALATVAEGWDLDEDAPLLVDALEAAGARAEPAMWDDPSVDWAGFDLVAIRSTWDYAQRPGEFAAWADRVGGLTRLVNPAHVVRWNIDKHYLGELADRGVAVVPTAYLEPGASEAEIARALGSDGEVVVKPTVSAGSRDTLRHTPAHLDAACRHAASLLSAGRSVMVQPYLRAVDRDGETGMVHFEGEFSHAFCKGPLLAPDGEPVDGLFAVERITARNPDPDELELARHALDAADQILGTGPLTYARVDLLRDDTGRPHLLELELVEPSFFLTTDPGAASRAADALVAASRRTPPPRPRTR